MHEQHLRLEYVKHLLEKCPVVVPAAGFNVQGAEVSDVAEQLLHQDVQRVRQLELVARLIAVLGGRARNVVHCENSRRIIHFFVSLHITFFIHVFQNISWNMHVN